MDNRKYRLNQAKSINSVEDTKDKVFLKFNSNILPVGTNKIVNAGEQFNKKERKNFQPIDNW
jgi:hypothetical protein